MNMLRNLCVFSELCGEFVFEMVIVHGSVSVDLAISSEPRTYFGVHFSVEIISSIDYLVLKKLVIIKLLVIL